MEQYNVTGMSCAACSARVEKAVSKVPGVTSCSVSPASLASSSSVGSRSRLATSRSFARFRPKALIELGFVMAALYCALAPLCTTLGQLYAVQVIGGISSGLTFAMLLGQCVKDIEPALRGAGMGLYQAVYGIGMTLGPILMGVMIDALGMDPAFFVMAVLSLLTACVGSCGNSRHKQNY